MTPDDIITAARACLGTPFRHLGRIPGKALDCAGLAVSVALALGLEVDDREAYGRTPANGLLETMLDSQPCLIRVLRPPRAGDLLLMRFGAGDPQHLAICAGETIIHAWMTVGKVAEHRFTDQWKSRVVRVYEFVGVKS
jgi:cell wall-associated NlpC family hydrolase